MKDVATYSRVRQGLGALPQLLFGIIGIRTGADVVVMTRARRVKFDGGFFSESAEMILAFLRAAASPK